MGGMRNLQLAWRMMAKSPGVSLIAVLSLALGIGANAAIFSIFEQILLRQLPVERPEELVNLTANGPRSGSNSTNDTGGQESIFSYAMFRDLEREQKGLTGLAAHRSFGANVAFEGVAGVAPGTLVSGSYFPVLGLQPAAGRLFTREDDVTPGKHALVVLSHRYWTTRFGADPGVIGKTLIVNGLAMTITGVAPAGFRGTSLSSQPAIFVPISMREALSPGWKGLAERRNYWIYLFGRRQAGVTVEAAEASLNTLYLNIIRQVEAPLQQGMSERGKKEFLGQRMKLEDGRRGQSMLLVEGRTPLVLLLAITAFVLLIACANIANLMLARAANRTREFSIRLSLGASRGQVMGQVMTESMLLAGLAGVASLGVAYATVSLIQGYLPGYDEQLLEAGLSWPMAGFTLTASLVTGLLFGLFPAYHAARQDLAAGMKDRAGWFRRGLVTAQFALALTLLVSAGMFLESLVKLMRVPLGMRTENVIGFRVSPVSNQYAPERSRALFEKLEERLGALPGAEGAVVSMVPLVAGNNWGNNVSVDGFEAGPDTDTHSMTNAVGPGYFRQMRVPLVEGREFTAADVAGRPKVALVNEAFQRKFGHGRSLVGRRMQEGRGGKNEIEIVGVVKDATYSSVRDAVPPLYFLPYRQQENFGEASLYVATKVPPEGLVNAIRGVLRELDPNLPLEDLKTMQAQINENISVDRMISTLAIAFAGVATLLAAIGLYGVLAFNVARRTREIGIRMALGETREGIRNRVLREVGGLATLGALLGLPAAIGLTRYAEELFYEVKSGDVLVLGGAVVLLGLVALAAGYLPAARAMKVEPLVALRYE